MGSVHAIASLVLQRLQDASEAFNSFQPHDNIGALERPQIPENDKGAIANVKSCSPFQSLTPFFRYANLGRDAQGLAYRKNGIPKFTYGWRLGYSPQGTWNKTRDHRRNNS